MKRLFGICLVTLLLMGSAMTASAVENEFGGYWRTRALSMQDFDGTDSGTRSYVDTRTRLFYTAKFNEKFKFVNKFEIDNSWGDTKGGDIGADAVNIEVKNSYADFFVGDHNFKVGIQPGVIARGFLFDDDFSGLTATMKLGTVSVPFMWMKARDNDITTSSYAISGDADATDRDYFAISPVFNLNETLSLNPYFLIDKEQGTDTMLYYLGADINAKIDKGKAWGTFILETGEQNDMDTTAFLVAGGADVGLVHGQIFYASGDEDGADDDADAFGLWKGQTYYWSEIMGEGIFDGPQSHNAPGVGVTNIIAANVGCKVNPMPKLTLTGDVWYAQLAEEVDMDPNPLVEDMEDVLGFEIDLKATYMLLDNLQMDVVGAYLIAGDATGEEDPIELGMQLSFKF